jgi:ribokinase
MGGIMKNKKILVVGSFVTDLIFTTDNIPEAGQTVFGRSFTHASGGKGANQAVQIGKLGYPVDMIGRVGDDVFGRELVKACRDAGVGVDHVIVSPEHSSGVSDVILKKTPSGQTQNRILMTPGANYSMTESDVAFLDDVFDEYSLVVLQFEIPVSVDFAIAKLAKKHGLPVIVNPAPSQPISDEFYQLIDYIVPNETEAFDLTGIKPVDENDQPDAGKLNDVYRFFAKKGVKNVIVTLGHHGVYYGGKNEQIFIPAIKNVIAVDPTAAGDSFIGAFAAAMSTGNDVIDSLNFANYVASITVGSLGAMPSLPTLKGVKDRLREARLETYNKVVRSFEPLILSDEEALEQYKQTIDKETKKILSSLTEAAYGPALKLIQTAQDKGNRIHVTGIGKPAHVSQYFASLLSSTGSPAYYLNATEAVHGSAGQLVRGDVVIAISNSGETSELKATIAAVKANGCRLLGVSGKADSWLAQQSDVHLLAPVSQEGDDLNRAPRASIIVETIVLQGLSILLQKHYGLTPRQYVKWHPGGRLGALRDNEK